MAQYHSLEFYVTISSMQVLEALINASVDDWGEEVVLGLDMLGMS